MSGACEGATKGARMGPGRFLKGETGWVQRALASF